MEEVKRLKLQSVMLRPVGAVGFRRTGAQMSHAVAMQVQLPELTSDEDDLKMLNDIVIPIAKSQAGFEKGIWMRTDGRRGLGVVVFDTAEHAAAAVEALSPAEEAPLLSCDLYEVGAEA